MRAPAALLKFSNVLNRDFLLPARLRDLVLAVAAVWIVWTFVVGDSSIPRILWVRHENDALRSEIEQMTAQEQELQTAVDALQDPKDQDTLERVAREQHSLVRDGEKLVRFYRPEDLEKADSE